MKKSTRIQLQLEARRIHGQLFIERDTKSTNVPLVHFKSYSLKILSIRKVQGAYLMLIIIISTSKSYIQRNGGT